jgi:hypothetical protein
VRCERLDRPDLVGQCVQCVGGVRRDGLQCGVAHSGRAIVEDGAAA